MVADSLKKRKLAEAEEAARKVREQEEQEAAERERERLRAEEEAASFQPMELPDVRKVLESAMLDSQLTDCGVSRTPAVARGERVACQRP